MLQTAKVTKNFIQHIINHAGRIDVLINNAGYGEYGPAEEIPIENVRKQFETNFFGAVELTQLVLPIMRQQHFGRIVNISSIGGDVYMPLGAFIMRRKLQCNNGLMFLIRKLKLLAFDQSLYNKAVLLPTGVPSLWKMPKKSSSR